MEAEFTVKVSALGDVYINDEFVSQLCFDPLSVAMAVMTWMDGVKDEEDNG